MGAFAEVEQRLRAKPRTWLVTGAAGFIGSNLVERLLSWNQRVVGLDNFSTGRKSNVQELLAKGGEFRFIEGDIRELVVCKAACEGADYVLHQAALGSVPRSIKDPIASHASNVDGTLNMLVAARDAKVSRFVYASSSSVYGDHPALPKVEEQIGKQLSPYAVTKRVTELYGSIFAGAYGLETVGLRYFNVFGRRQDPNGPYAAVIPRWVAALLKGERCTIYGDGETSRDFCYIENVIQANVLAATAGYGDGVMEQVLNVAYGERTTLKALYEMIRDRLAKHVPGIAGMEARFEAFRPGDIRHSLADVSKARRVIGYEPEWSVPRGLDETMEWYVREAKASRG